MFKLSFSNFFNLSNFFLEVYIFIYISIRFIINLLRYTIVCRKASAKFILQCNFFLQICTFLSFIRLALIISGDIECNPGPENIHNQNLSLCHWNLNGIAANNFIKISLLEAYNSIHNFDVICISETFLDSDYSIDDQRLSIKGYVMIRSDHPSNTKTGGVCIYYKEHLPFVRRNDISIIDECLVLLINR